MTAQESFNVRKDNVNILLTELREQVRKANKDAKKKPLDWGHSGSMASVQENLENALIILVPSDD